MAERVVAFHAILELAEPPEKLFIETNTYVDLDKMQNTPFSSCAVASLRFVAWAVVHVKTRGSIYLERYFLPSPSPN